MKRIRLSGRKLLLVEALVDDEDYESLSKETWHLCMGYASRSVLIGGKWKRIYMHREVLKAPPFEHRGSRLQTDHINGNRLDNRKKNLRLVTPAQNQRNSHWKKMPASSRFKGVDFNRATGLWRAFITWNGRLMYLGYHKTEEVAKRVRLAVRRVYALAEEEGLEL